jgi:hypothetical protein
LGKFNCEFSSFAPALLLWKIALMHKFYRLLAVVALFGWLAGTARGDTFHLIDGSTITGEIISMNETGVVLKAPDGQYLDRTPWGKLAQADLIELKQNPKAAIYVEPFIEITQEEKMKKTEIDVKEVAERLPRPPRTSIFAAMFSSTIGLFALFMMYAANIYAAYEISIFRAQSPALVCGLAAVVPVIVPIVFLSMPPNIKKKEAPVEQLPQQSFIDPGTEAAMQAEAEAQVVAEAAAAAGKPLAPALPPTKTFARGQFTFNRRFFETQMPGFFAMARPEADREMVLSVKSARGTYVAQRISRISPNEMYITVLKGHASEDISIPFLEIQEVQIKHKDA